MRRSAFLSRPIVAAIVAISCAIAPIASRAQGHPGANEQQLAEQAFALQEAGHYAEAIAIYLKAYEISRDGLTLLNIATIYDRKLHEAALAAEYYRRYVMSSDAEPARVRKVTERLEVLKREAEEQRARSVATPPSAQTEPSAPASAVPPPSATVVLPVTPAEQVPSGLGPMKATAIVVGSVGVAGVGAAMVLGYLAKQKNDDANSVCAGQACTTQAGVQSAKDAGKFATASTVSFIGGLALVASGVTLFAIAPSPAAPAQAGRLTVVPAGGPTGGGLSVQGVF
jgi:hypothetical protein